MNGSIPGTTREMEGLIENHRTHMNRLADELGHVHPSVMKVSQQLDELLLQYYRMAFRAVSTCSPSA